MPPTDARLRPAPTIRSLLLALVAASALPACSSDEVQILVDTLAIRSSGGRANAQTGTGGDAGMISVELDHGGGGAIEARTAGTVDASFVPTPGLVADLGPNPLVVSADLAIGIATVEPALGTPYLVAGLGSLFVSDGNAILGDETPVSGLEVQPGATLTLPLNHAVTPSADLDFTHDVVIDGVLTVVDVDIFSRGWIDLSTEGSYSGRGAIQTHGRIPGQHGGDIRVFVEGAGYNDGPFTSYGADNANGNGGTGGEILFRTDFVTLGGAIENTGRLDSHGGRVLSGTGMGGDAGAISVLPYLALWSSGDIDASGGNGLQGGGAGGDVLIAGYYRGELRSSGRITADGGDTTTGTGGDAGSVRLEALGGTLASSGAISARGGDAAAAGGSGGGGGDVLLYVTSSDDNWEPAPVLAPAGDLWASGAIDSSGGQATGPGGTGGNGGSIAFEIENDLTSGAQSIHLLGYDRIVGQGGNGFTGGLGNVVTGDVAAMSGTPTGPIVLDTSIDASGGDANPELAGSTGGDAGDASLRAGSITYSSVTLAGGTGATTGANGSLFTSP